MINIPGDFACVASKHAKFVIANAARKKFVIISAIEFSSPKQNNVKYKYTKTHIPMRMIAIAIMNVST